VGAEGEGLLQTICEAGGPITLESDLVEFDPPVRPLVCRHLHFGGATLGPRLGLTIHELQMMTQPGSGLLWVRKNWIASEANAAMGVAAQTKGRPAYAGLKLLAVASL